MSWKEREIGGEGGPNEVEEGEEGGPNEVEKKGRRRRRVGP